jgi:hypothetical protein
MINPPRRSPASRRIRNKNNPNIMRVIFVLRGMAI